MVREHLMRKLEQPVVPVTAPLTCVAVPVTSEAPLVTCAPLNAYSPVSSPRGDVLTQAIASLGLETAAGQSTFLDELMRVAQNTPLPDDFALDVAPEFDFANFLPSNADAALAPPSEPIAPLVAPSPANVAFNHNALTFQQGLECVCDVLRGMYERDIVISSDGCFHLHALCYAAKAYASELAAVHLPVSLYDWTLLAKMAIERLNIQIVRV